MHTWGSLYVNTLYAVLQPSSDGDREEWYSLKDALAINREYFQIMSLKKQKEGNLLI